MEDILAPLWIIYISSLMKRLFSWSPARNLSLMKIYNIRAPQQSTMLAVLTLLLTTLTLCQKHTLTVYQGLDCHYCKFATRQIQQLIAQNFWGDRLTLQVVDCQQHIEQCRDGQEKPLLVINDTRGRKLGELEGVRSRIYFRDWIGGWVRSNPMETGLVDEGQGDKYTKIVIKNVEQALLFYERQRQSLMKVRDHRLDILKVVKDQIEAEQMLQQVREEDQSTQQQSIKQKANLKQQKVMKTIAKPQNINTFLDLKYVSIILALIVAYLICQRFKARARTQTGYASVSIPVQQD